MTIRLRIALFAVALCLALSGAAATAAPAASARPGAAIPQATPEKPLDADAVAALLDELKDGLPDVIDSEDSVNAIGEKWDAHQDLTGKTKSQILKILMADVRSVVADKAAQNNIWASWTAEEKSDQQPPVQAPKAVPSPVPPSPPPTKPATETKPLLGTVLYFDGNKGYGMIRPDRGGPDIFVHISALEGAGINTLNQNDRVTFEIEFDNRGKSRAIHVNMAPE